MKSKSISVKIRIEKMHIKDKKRRISAPQPDLHIVQVIANTGNKDVIIREERLDTKVDADAWFKRLKDIFGIV